jgi:hypothetical protein
MFDLYSNKEEIDLAHNNILEMILGLVILKLNMKTVFDPNLHFYAAVHLGVRGKRVHN